MREIVIMFGILGLIASLFVISRGLRKPLGRFSFTEFFVREKPFPQQSGAQIIGEGIFGLLCSVVVIILAQVFFH